MMRELGKLNTAFATSSTWSSEEGTKKYLASMHAAESFLVLSSNLARHSSSVIGELVGKRDDLMGAISAAYTEAMWRLSYLDAAKARTAKITKQGGKEGKEEDTPKTIPTTEADGNTSARAGAPSSEAPSAVDGATTGSNGNNLVMNSTEDIINVVETMNVDGNLDAVVEDVQDRLTDFGGEAQRASRDEKNDTKTSLGEDEGLASFINSVRNFYVSLSRSFLMPRRRDELPPTVSSTTKLLVSVLASKLSQHLEFTRGPHDVKVCLEVLSPVFLRGCANSRMCNSGC